MGANTVDENFICPISQLIMVDPVVAADGETYEREMLEDWLKTHNTSPVSKKELAHKTVNPSTKQQRAIQRYLEIHPEHYDNNEVYLPKAWIKEFTDTIFKGDIPTLKTYLARDKRLLTCKLEVASAPGGPLAAISATPLELACQNGNPEIVDFFIDELAARNLLDQETELKLDLKPLNILLEKFLTSADYTKCELLLKLGADVEQPDNAQNTLLHRVVNQDNQPAAKWLLEHKADIEARNSTRDTPLLIAVSKKSISLVNFLLEKEADIEARNLKGVTPLYSAVQSSNVKLANVLLLHDADPTSLRNSESLLHIATTKHMLGRLFKTAAATLIDAKDLAGNTALHRAASSGNKEVLAYLLEKGANRNILNNARQKPFDCAKARPVIEDLFSKTVQEIKNNKKVEMELLKKEVSLLNERISQQDKIIADLVKRMANLPQPETPKGFLSVKNIFTEQATPKEEPKASEPTVKSMFSFGV